MTDQHALLRVARLYRQVQVDPYIRDEVEDVFRPLGLTFGQFDDLLAEARHAEAEHAVCGETVVGSPVYTTEARRAVSRLASLGFPAEAIVVLFDGILLEEQVLKFLESRAAYYDEKDVVRLHIKGRTALEIGRELGKPRQTVESILKRAGLTPNIHARRVPGEVRLEIIRLKRAGKTQGEIAKAVALSVSQIKNVLKLARRQGLIDATPQAVAS